MLPVWALATLATLRYMSLQYNNVMFRSITSYYGIRYVLGRVEIAEDLLAATWRTRCLDNIAAFIRERCSSGVLNEVFSRV